MRFFNPAGRHGGQATDAVEGGALSLSSFLLCCALLPGCGTIVVLLDSSDTGEGAKHGLVYCGVCWDCRYLGHHGQMFTLFDIPFSLVADTLIFPYTFTYQCIEFFRTDERLHGTWRSDEDLVVAERQWFLYHDLIKRHEYDWDYRNQRVQRNCRPVITFSEHQATINLEGTVRAFRYRVVRQYEDSVVMGGIPESSELQTVKFLPDGILLEAFWGQPRHYSKADPGQQVLARGLPQVILSGCR